MVSSSTNVRQDETERLKSLLQYEILDTLPDPAFDEIARLAAAFAHAPYAYIGFLDWSRVWFKSTIGFAGRQVRRNGSPCQFLLLEGKPLLVSDALADGRFSSNGILLDDGLQCRSYAGAPLCSPSGAILGTLSVCSGEANAFSRSHLETLQMLARQVVTRLELYASSHLQENVVRSRQRSDQALTAERNFVAAVLNTVGALVMVFDTAGRIVRFNRACELTSGYTFADLAGRAFPEELFPASEREVAVRHFEQVRLNQSNQSLPQSFEINWRTQAGGLRRIAFTATALTNAQNDVSFVIMSGVDVTEQREAEIALRRSEDRYRQLVESSLGFLFTHDLNGRLLSMNSHMCSLFGYTAAEGIGTDLRTWVDAAHLAEYDAYLAALRKDPQQPYEGRFYLRGKAGKLAIIAYRNNVVQEGAEPVVLSHGIDITGQTQAEEERRRLDRMKDEFISVVSHELRTPLTSLRASLGLVTSGALEKRPEKIPQMLQIALANCDRLVRLVNDIVDFERIGNRTLPLHPSEWNAIDLLRRAIEREQANAERAGLTFRLDVQPIDVWIDGDRVLQVLGNLIRNAIKFSEKGREIRLGARVSNPKEVTFEVEDQGQGIPAEKLDVIFDRFQQADGSDARLQGGTGLGLALCRGIIEQHGGRIWARSNPGCGSTFYFTVEQFIPKDEDEVVDVRPLLDEETQR